MNIKRQHWIACAVLLTLAGCLMVACGQKISAQPPEAKAPIVPVTSFALVLDQPIVIDVKSPAVTWRDTTTYLVQLGRANFKLEQQSHLKATLAGGVTTFDDVDYDIHVAVFDARGRMLGTAKAVCPVPRIWVGMTGMTSRTLDFDFGISRDYSQARFFTVAINNVKVLTPDDWQKKN